jgi:hypothetical protein
LQIAPLKRAPAGAVVRESPSTFWSDSIGLRNAERGLGTALTVYGAYQSSTVVSEAIEADVREGTMGEQTAAAIAHEVGGWAGAIVGAETAAPWGAVCGPAVWFCGPILGIAGGGVGYLIGSGVFDATIYAGKAAIDAVIP